MPTGYTHAVQDGTITKFEDFAWQCARAMGALIMMRDLPDNAPIPERFEPQTEYYDKTISAAQTRLSELQTMSPAAVREAAQQAYAEGVKDDDDYRTRKADHRARYQAMLAKVEAWSPPTEDHIGFKEFMTEQLTESIRFDCSPGGFMKAPKKMEPERWLAEQICTTHRDIAYYTEERAKEVMRTESRNQWLVALRKSLVETE